MKIYYLRNTLTTDNEQGINASQTDSPLSDEGKKQATDLIEILAKKTYDLFIVSPLQRSINTIKPYLDTLDNPKIIVEPLITERDLGLLTNSKVNDGQIAKHQKESKMDKVSWMPPQGESIKDVYLRAEKFYDKLFRYKCNSFLICGHQNFLRCLEFVILDKPIEDYYSDNPPCLVNGELRSYIVN